ncbi:hypothetical protein JCM10908_001383 [Rhodotorula pacifica]|uniref:putative carboxylic ester hydrolase n=1 Tax=Rhodotorula pacifica TaxID=1495444 RepID=UPI0031803AF4
MPPARDYFSFGIPGSDGNMRGVGSDHLLTPSEALGYLSPLDSPRLAGNGSLSPTASSSSSLSPSGRLAALSQQISEAASEAISSEELEAQFAEKAQLNEARTRGRQLSPSQLAAVLSQDPSPAPEPQGRFLHGGPPLSDLEAPSAALPNSEKRNKPIANSEWRAFSDEEEAHLQSAWRALQNDTEARKRRDQKKGKETVKGEGGIRRVNEDEADPGDSPYLVPVGLDNLFTVSLLHNVLYPAFWTGSPVRVLLCHWFYAPPSPAPGAGSLPSHQIKPYPVDPSLSAALDHAYNSIRPWDEAYAAELASALRGGKEAQQRLSVELGVVNEAGTEDNLGIEVIFESEGRGRVYSKGMMASVSKAFLSSGKSLGGGQIVLRGWDALRDYLEEKAPKKAVAKPAPSEPAQPPLPSKTSPPLPAKDSQQQPTTTSPEKSHQRSVSNGSNGEQRSSSKTRSESPGPGLLASLRNRIVGAPAPTDPATVTAEPNDPATATAGGSVPNETQEAVQLRREEIGTPDELVLVIHGIGQGLAGTYDSFSFVWACNAFRSACTNLSTSPTLSPLLNGKRAQFIPVLWRAELDFDEVDESADAADEYLANRFSLADIEVPNSIPFLRQVVSGLVLDVPFYLSPSHKTKMLKSVVRECNRIYTLFSRRNPEFEAKGGKVSIIAHSLGSVMAADILSSQPTFVKQPELSARTPGPRTMPERAPPALSQEGLTFAFDTRVLILVGSPLAFFLHLGKGQLIARKGRERTKNVGRDIALDRAGRYGCLACDSVYNVYAEADPVAFALNAAVDARYSKLIKPVPIPSTNQTLLQNLSDAYHRVSRIFDMSSIWGGSSSNTEPKQTGDQAKEQAEKQVDKQAEATSPSKPAIRPLAALKRMPSERPRFGKGTSHFEWVERAEKRMKALNPSGCIDYFLPSDGINQYLDALTAHQDYWADRRFSTFVLTQLFADESHLEKTGREEVGIHEEDETDDP